MKVFQKIKNYVVKQIKFSVGNLPSVPMGLFITYALTDWGHLFYGWGVFWSFVITVWMNFEVQRLLRIIETTTFYDYLTKLGRFYIGNIPAIFLAPVATIGVVSWFHIWYLLASFLAMIVTTVTTFLLQLALRVIRL